MKFGLHSVNLHTCGYPDAAARIGRAAEAAGFESLWVADHVVMPDPPVAGDVPDKATLDAYAAAGVDRLILRPRPEMDAAALERFAAEAGRALGLRAA